MKFGGLVVGFHLNGCVPLSCYLGLIFYLMKSRSKLQKIERNKKKSKSWFENLSQKVRF